MIKTYLQATTFLLSIFFSSLLIAGEQGNVPVNTAFSGPYLGGTIGWGSNKNTITGTFLGAPIDCCLGTEGINGGIFGGYGWLVSSSNFYLGIELAALADDLNETAIITGRKSFSLDKSDSLQATGRAGLRFLNALPFIRLGLDNSRWRGSVFTVESHERLNGFLAGVGVDVIVHPHVFFGVEYDHTVFDNFIVTESLINSLNFKPKHSTGRLRLAYIA